MVSTYCQMVASLEPGNVHKEYHDTEYGFPINDDNELFGRLLLEINQAGLSWTTILKKQQNFRLAYANFDIEKVAAFNEDDKLRLLQDSGIIRNRLKVEAAIFNAMVIIEIKSKYGSFKSWLDDNHPKSKQEWVKLFKKHFKFTGGEIVGEFLMSTGYLPNAHEESCPVYKRIIEAKPAWIKQS